MEMEAPWWSGLQTGDLLFFNGQNFASRLIEWSGHSPWSHVGMVVRLRLQGRERVCLWESVNNAVHTRALALTAIDDGARDEAPFQADALYEPDAYRTGARLCLLEERLQTLHERLGVARLQALPDPRRDRAYLQAAVLQAVKRYNGRPYEHSWGTLVRSWLDCCDANEGCTFNPEDLGAFFCSELVAQTLRDAELIRWTLARGGAGSSGEITVADVARLTDSLNLLHYRPPRLVYAPIQEVIY